MQSKVRKQKTKIKNGILGLYFVAFDIFHLYFHSILIFFVLVLYTVVQ
jgi:hypothetical protein